MKNRLINKFRTVLIILISSTYGCASIGTYMGECFLPECNESPVKIEYYKATKMDVSFWKLPENPDIGIVGKSFGYTMIALDFPVSIVIDTLVLPFQYIGYSLNRPEKADFKK